MLKVKSVFHELRLVGVCIFAWFTQNRIHHHHHDHLGALISVTQGTDGETHERQTSSAKQQAADRRIEIQPAEDEDGKCLIKFLIKTLKIRVLNNIAIGGKSS